MKMTGNTTHPIIEAYQKRRRYFQYYYRMELKERGAFKGFRHDFHFEDPKILHEAEKVLFRKRDYTFHMPKPGEPVILICSGGFDSVSLWGMLLEKFKVKVFPLHFVSPKPKENEAFEYFYHFYKTRYKDLVGPAHYFDYTISFQFDKTYNLIRKTERDLDFFLSNLIHKKKDKYYLSPMYPAARMGLFAFKALEYALLLNYEKDIRVKTIFIGIVPEDCILTHESSLTTLRLMNLNICQIMGDYTWQFTSFAMEAGTGLFILKTHLAKFCQKHDIPIGKSWSCDGNHSYHCGICVGCWKRKRIFKIAEIKDKTIYKNPDWVNTIRLNLGIKKVFHTFITLLSKKTSKITHKNTIRQIIWDAGTKLKVKNDISIKKRGQTITVMYGEGRKKYLVRLNETASFIFLQLLDRPMNMIEIQDVMTNTYQVDKKLLREDILKFIRQGINRYIIRVE